MTKSRLERIYERERIVDAAFSVPCNRKAQEAFAWKPGIDLRSGLEQTWHWLSAARTGKES